MSHGAKTYELLKQKQYAAMDVYDQVLQLFTAKHRFIKNVPIEKIQDYEEKLLIEMHKNHQDIIDSIKEKKAMSTEDENNLKEAIGKFTEDYLS